MHFSLLPDPNMELVLFEIAHFSFNSEVKRFIPLQGFMHNISRNCFFVALKIFLDYTKGQLCRDKKISSISFRGRSQTTFTRGGR